ncbi:MAG: hypothetical protein WD871_03490 [Xanthobacteraceae bacterium]
MMEFLDQAKRALWAFVELGFLTILAVMLIYLILGQDSGAFVSSVAGNVLAFANAMAPQGLVGIAIVLALIYLIVQRKR